MDRLTAYKVLDLPEGSDEAQVKSAYKALAQKYDISNYSAGPLQEEAEAKMEEINEAFDVLMSYLRTGNETAFQNASSAPSTAVGRYPDIRQLINNGRVDDALAELNALPDRTQDAEWNFLMGSAYYYKGWLEQALHYFQIAVRLAPGNPEYEAALRNLQSSVEGTMQGNPYVNADPNAAAMSCACNTCTMMCCMDACCSMCRGF